MDHRREPAVVVDAAIAHDLVVLRRVAFLGVGIVERIQHAGAGHRDLLDAVDDLGLGDPRRFQDRRGDVDEVGVLPALLALGLDALGPVHDGAGHVAAAVGHEDAPGRRRGAGHGPAHGVIGVGLRPAVLVQAAQQVGDVLRRVVERRPLHERAVDLADRRSTVVARDVDDDGVVEHAQLVDGVDEAADFVVRALHQGRVHFHLPGEDLLLVGRERRPFLDVRGVLGQLRVGGHDAHLLLPRQDLLTQLIPALVELALVQALFEPGSSAGCAGDGRHSKRST